jgi:hypothetical protein
VILFFVDDSGNTGSKLDHPIERIHWLVAVAIDEALVRDIDRAVYECCCRYFGPSAASSPGFEVKGSDLFGGRGWAEKMPPAERIECYSEVLGLLAPHDARLFVRGINKPAYATRMMNLGRKPQPPYDRAFQYLIESIDAWLEGLPTQTRGLLVADEQQEAGRRMVHQFNQWAHQGTSGGYKAGPIVRLLPALHYVRSVDSRMVQLADCAAFVRNRVAKIAGQPKNDSDVAVLNLWARHCAGLVIHDRVWP